MNGSLPKKCSLRVLFLVDHAKLLFATTIAHGSGDDSLKTHCGGPQSILLIPSLIFDFSSLKMSFQDISDVRIAFIARHRPQFSLLWPTEKWRMETLQWLIC